MWKRNIFSSSTHIFLCLRKINYTSRPDCYKDRVYFATMVLKAVALACFSMIRKCVQSKHHYNSRPTGGGVSDLLKEPDWFFFSSLEWAFINNQRSLNEQRPERRTGEQRRAAAKWNVWCRSDGNKQLQDLILTDNRQEKSGLWVKYKEGVQGFNFWIFERFFYTIQIKLRVSKNDKRPGSKASILQPSFITLVSLKDLDRY